MEPVSFSVLCSGCSRLILGEQKYCLCCQNRQTVESIVTFPPPCSLLCAFICVFTKEGLFFCLFEGINGSTDLCTLRGGFIDEPFLTTSALDGAGPRVQTMQRKGSTLEALPLSQLKSEPITCPFTPPLSKKSEHAVSSAPGCLSASASYRFEYFPVGRENDVSGRCIHVTILRWRSH